MDSWLGKRESDVDSLHVGDRIINFKLVEFCFIRSIDCTSKKYHYRFIPTVIGYVEIAPICIRSPHHALITYTIWKQLNKHNR